MVKKLTEDEKTFLINKYISLGYSEDKAIKKVNRNITLIAISHLTMII